MIRATAKKRRRIRIIVTSMALLAAATALFGYAFRDGIQYFRTPSEVADRQPDAREVFRLGGMVEEGSISREGLQMHFVVSDGSERVAVVYSGIAPDLFGEGEGVVATGRLVDGRFEAHELLARHDEDYTPRELVGVIAQ